LVTTTKKVLASGKGGEAALKMDVSGAFITPTDTIADNVKLMEEILTQSGLKDKVKVSVKFIGDTMYQPDK
jgi:hypothetical protein